MWYNIPMLRQLTDINIFNKVVDIHKIVLYNIFKLNEIVKEI